MYDLAEQKRCIRVCSRQISYHSRVQLQNQTFWVQSNVVTKCAVAPSKARKQGRSTYAWSRHRTQHGGRPTQTQTDEIIARPSPSGQQIPVGSASDVEWCQTVVSESFIGVSKSTTTNYNRENMASRQNDSYQQHGDGKRIAAWRPRPIDSRRPLLYGIAVAVAMRKRDNTHKITGLTEQLIHRSDFIEPKIRYVRNIDLVYFVVLKKHLTDNELKP